MPASSAVARRTAAAVLVLAALALAGGAPALDRLRAWSGQPDVCEFRARNGFDCLGCGGTRAFADAARGRLAAGFRRNPIGAMTAVVSWMAAAAALVALARGRLAPLGAALAGGTLLLGATFVTHAAWWWHALPAGHVLR